MRESCSLLIRAFGEQEAKLIARLQTALACPVNVVRPYARLI